MNDWTLLIDFGTSFTRAAIADADGRIEPVELDGSSAMPSGILAEPSGRLTTGRAAWQGGRLTPERWDRAPGRSLARAEVIQLGQVRVDPVAAVAAVLQKLSAEAVRRRGGRPREVRLTVPDRWYQARRDALRAAAVKAGLGSPPLAGPPQLVDQSVATALELGRLGRYQEGARIALFGLGAGSTEISVLEYTAEGVLVRALGGIEGVGGEQFDGLIFRQLIANSVHRADPAVARNLWQPPDASWRQAAEDLFRQVRGAKEELSGQRGVQLETGPLIGVPLQLSRIEVEAVLRPLILRSARELATTVELAGLRVRQLDAILTTGGSSRIPLVTRALFDVTGVQPQPLADVDQLAGAALWTPQSRVDPQRTRHTVAAGQTGEEAAAAAAEAAAALAATGALDLSSLAAVPPPAEPAAAPAPAPAVKRAALSAWRRRWPVIAVVAMLLLVAGLVLNGAAFGDDDPGPAPGPSTGTPTPQPSGTEGTPTASPALTLPAATGLSAQTRNISVVLAWDEVPDAEAYLVYRDAGTPQEAVRTVTATSFTDRPGDGAEHRYSIAALDAEELEGPRGTEVAATAPAPYGAVQYIASNWTAVVPVTPGKRGSAGQTCKGSATNAEHSTGRIRCTFGNGVRLIILSYAGTDDRDRSRTELAALKGVAKGKWKAALPGGAGYSGRQLTAGAKAPGGPWRWWTYDQPAGYALYADWPKHSAKQLSSWWKQKAPFRL